MAAKKKTDQALNQETKETAQAAEQKATQTATQVAEQEATQAAVSTGTVKGGSLNVRRCPQLTAPITRVLKNGETVEILEAIKEWYRIADGYIRAEYVETK